MKKPKAKKPVRVPLTRRLSQKQADRIRKLMSCCSTLEADGKLTIIAGSETFGGPPVKNLIDELSMLLHGHAPDRWTRCSFIR